MTTEAGSSNVGGRVRWHGTASVGGMGTASVRGGGSGSATTATQRQSDGSARQTLPAYSISEQQLEILQNDPNIYREYLKGLTENDKEILDLYQEYTTIRDFIKKRNFEDLKNDLEEIRNNYENTKKKLENVLYNKFKPNKTDFYEKNSEFLSKLKSFISNLRETKNLIEIENKLY